LTEVLVAIFVMAIGLLALLTLFPIGALSMAQAIRDDRTGHSGKNGYAIWTALNMANDPLVTNNNLPLAVPGSSTSYFLNPYPNVNPTTVPAGTFLAPNLSAGWDGTSYPIFIDPFGCQNFASLGALGGLPYPSLGGVPRPDLGGYSSIPRQPVSSIVGIQAIDKWCTLTDDITFSGTATPSVTTGAVQRENRYSWAWLARLPNINDPTRADVQVVVYSGRGVTNLGETAYPGVFWGGFWDPTAVTDPNPAPNPPQLAPTSNFVDVPYQPGLRPQVRLGTWICDATMEYWNGAANVPDPHGYFYRVVGISELGTLPSPPYPAGSQGLRLEIQGTFKNASPTNSGTVLAPVPYGVLVVMENVVEVF
jgi:hypothetical protein